MKRITDFMNQFDTSISLDEGLIVKKQNRYFLLNKHLKRLTSKEFFYAGVYLGKAKGGIFFPSFPLLAMIAEKERTNKIAVDGKTEWLYICGRDVFKRGIVSVNGSRKKGNCTLIVNHRGECLGFGRITFNLDEMKDGRKVAVKNISDLGDFLRRER